MSKTLTAALAALTFTTAALTIPSVAFAKGNHHGHHRHGYWNGKIWVVVTSDDDDECRWVWTRKYGWVRVCEY
jgi:hypothetical protein